MGVIIAHASISENNTVNGVAGDQTQKEVCTRSWYNKPWNCVIRFNDTNIANLVAECMEKAAANNHIGYSQAQRNSLLIECRKYNYDVSKVTKNVNCDCSSLVSVACMYAGIEEKQLFSFGNCCTTRTIKNALNKTGEVTILTASDFTTKDNKLKRGDILLSEGHHVAVVVKTDNDNTATTINPKQAVKDVLNGKYGSGDERKAKLKAAGYNYDEVQRKVNEIVTVAETLHHLKKQLGEYWEIALDLI